MIASITNNISSAIILLMLPFYIRLSIHINFSIEKGLEKADSDVDIFIVCNGEKSKLEDKLADMTNISQNKFGNPVSLMIKHKEELQDLKTRSIFREIKNGEIIFKREGFEW